MTTQNRKWTTGSIKHTTLAIVCVLVVGAGAAHGKYSGGTGEPNNRYRIATAADLNDIGNHVEDFNKCFLVTNDINMAGYTYTAAVIARDTNTLPYFQGTAFTGVFDGNNYVISNLTITAPNKNHVGLFGYVGSGGEIKYLGIADVNMRGRDFVGGLVGLNDFGSVTSCYAAGSVTGFYCVGGLVGYNYYGNVTFCYATGAVSGDLLVGGLVGANDYGSVTSCYATGGVSGTRFVGGLVGENWDGSVTSCYATGGVSGTRFVAGLVGNNCQGKVIRCYSTGRPTGSSFVGGLCGDKTAGGGYEDTGNFWDTETSQMTTSAMGTGKTTAEMQKESTFTAVGWDSVEVWDIGENQTYPFLRVHSAGDINHDDKVNWLDLAILAGHWLEEK